MERGDGDEREGSSQQNTIWKQFQAKAKPLLSPKLGTRESEDKKERGMRMFKKIKWKQSDALDRVISSSQPDLLFSGADLHADASACDKPHAHPCPRRPSSSPNKPTVSQLVHCHHKSSSLGSECMGGLSDPLSHGASGAGEAVATAADPQAQLENQHEAQVCRLLQVLFRGYKDLM
uniref:Uncharacterized protein n=1 Tax=Neogobius melanostomus TaxID=47308 RepID=A0A8C6T6F1_9GOBI